MPCLASSPKNASEMPQLVPHLHVQLVVLLRAQRDRAQLAEHERALLERLAQVVVVLESEARIGTGSGQRSGFGSDIFAGGAGEAGSGRSPARASCRKRTVSPGSTHLVDVRGRYRSVWSDRRDDGVGARKSARPRHPRKGTEKWGSQQHPWVGSRGGRSRHGLRDATGPLAHLRATYPAHPERTC